VSSPQTPDPSADTITGRAWLVLLVLAGAVFLEGIDVSMMGVALPSIREDLGMSTSSLQWVVSAYVLGYGGFVLLGGRAADLLGRRRMFLTWLVVFILFSGLGGLASEGWMLIAARFVTGVAAGFMAPAGLSIITTMFKEGDARNRALLVYAGTAAAGFSLGMVVGGVLTSIGWRWTFFAPVILASLLLAVAVRVVPEAGRANAAVRSFDVPGALSITAAMLLLVFTVVQAPEVAIESTLATGAAAALMFVVFVRVERRAAAPLVRLGILRSVPLLRANAGVMLFIGSFVAFQFIAVLYMQELREWSALETGLALLIAGIDAIIAPTLTPILVKRFGNAVVIATGVALAVAAYALFLPLGADWTYAAMLPTLVLLGLAFSFAFGGFTIAATDGVAEHEQGLASGLLSVSIQFGAALGLAIAAAVNVAATASNPSPAELLDGYRAALLVPAAASVIGLGLAASGLRRRRAEAALGTR
jgi:predicted MFS family arabinose efflux permease